jgi:hypothetical protein
VAKTGKKWEYKPCDNSNEVGTDGKKHSPLIGVPWILIMEFAKHYSKKHK